MKWSYVEGIDEKGNPVLIGPYDSYTQAQRVADRQTFGEAKVVEYPTSSLATATGMWKKEKADAGSISIAARRVRHPKEDINV